eukprot:511926_1
MGTCFSITKENQNPYNTLILADEEKRVVDDLIRIGYDNTISRMALSICSNVGDINEMIDTIHKLETEQQKIGEIQEKSDFTNSQQTLDEAVSHLVNIGFDYMQSLQALVAAKYDLQGAVNILSEKQPESQMSLDNEEMKCIQTTLPSNNNCEYHVSECQIVSKLISFLKKYVDSKNEYSTEELDCFHHVLFNHNTDNDFENMYQQIGHCDEKKCDAISRYNQRGTQNDSDKIHCHFMHSYRSTGKYSQQKQISKTIKLPNPATNKFKRLSVSCSKNNLENIVYGRYNFGQRFYYWPFFKNCKLRDCVPNHGHKCGDFYVGPKFSNFKEELFINNVAIEQFNNEYSKAQRHIHTCHCKKIVAHDDTLKNDSKQNFQKSPISKKTTSQGLHWKIVDNLPPQFDTQKYGISPGTPITLNHLIAIILYCSYDMLSYKFSESFRKLKKNESNDELKKRHKNFHFFAKYVVEAVNVYGTEQYKQNITAFYHGIDTEMIFNDIRCFMYQPFSTTSSWEVAVNFSNNSSNNSGMILDVSCSMFKERYFDCAWLSDYPSESEKLFIRNRWALQISNITIAVSGLSFRTHIQALAVLDCFTEATPFQSDFNFEKRARMYHIKPKGKTVAVDGDPIPPIDPMVQLMAVKLIKHELSRYSLPEGKKMKALHHYIETLLHNICMNKCSVEINVSLFDFNVDDQEVQNQMSFFYRLRYQRLPFLKNVFFDEESNTVRIDLLSAMYPNLFAIVISNIKGYISPLYFHTSKSIWFDRMLQYLTHIGQCIGSVKVLFNEKQRPTLKSLVASYIDDYADIGWCIALMSSQEIIFRTESELSPNAMEGFNYDKTKSMLKQWGKHELVIPPFQDFTYN